MSEPEFLKFLNPPQREAVTHGETGLVADVADPAAWVAALRQLADDDALAARMQAAARRWTEDNYDTRRNALRLASCFAEASRR